MCFTVKPDVSLWYRGQQNWVCLVRRCFCSEKLKGIGSSGNQLRNCSSLLCKRTGKFVVQQVYALVWFGVEVFHSGLIVFWVIYEA